MNSIASSPQVIPNRCQGLRNSYGRSGVWGRLLRARSKTGRLSDDHLWHLCTQQNSIASRTPVSWRVPWVDKRIRHLLRNPRHQIIYNMCFQLKSSLHRTESQCGDATKPPCFKTPTKTQNKTKNKKQSTPTFEMCFYFCACIDSKLIPNVYHPPTGGPMVAYISYLG